MYSFRIKNKLHSQKETKMQKEYIQLPWKVKH